MKTIRAETETRIMLGSTDGATPVLHLLYDDNQDVVVVDGAAAAPTALSEAVLHGYCLAALLAQRELDLQDVSAVELSLQWVGASEMQSLNLQYRGKDSPTNVLSFASELPVMPLESSSDESSDSGGLLALGDLVFCADVVEREALEQSKLSEHHWAHMLVHGMLHLCGYDHEDDAQAETMEALEIQILSSLGIPSPYCINMNNNG